MVGFEIPNNTPSSVPPKSATNLGKIVLPSLVVAGALVVGAVYFMTQGKTSPSTMTSPIATNQATTRSGITFSPQKKSLHFVTSTPSHESVLAASPINVVIDFNFDLGSKSFIKVSKDGVDYTEGVTSIDSSKLTLRQTLKADLPDGLYQVTYDACWPDNTCHDGAFQFAVDRTKAAGYQDETGKSEVTVQMKDIAFKPLSLKVSRGTKVTWVNDDSVGHYVNTDSHPAHSYFETQNSRLIDLGKSYSVTFDKAGAFPYHCSAHTSMTAQIIVI